MTDFLTTILAHKRRAIEQAARIRPLPELMRQAEIPRADRRSLADALSTEGIRVIAEIKRASPSRGDIHPALDVATLARAYAAGGAAAVSVLTETKFFKGRNQDLPRARAEVNLPILRKDFIIDAYQLYESVVLGADAVLLIVRILEDAALERLHGLALDLGLEPLVEVFDAEDAARARRLRPRLVGINNRDLRYFHTSLDNAPRVASAFNDETIVVAASGIRGPDDVRRARRTGIRRFLIGEYLAAAADPAATLAVLLEQKP